MSRRDTLLAPPVDPGGMERRPVALALLLCAALVLAGCGGGGGATATPTDHPEANRVQTAAVAASEDAATYRLAANVTRVQRANGQRVTTRLNSTGAVNRTASALVVNQTANGPAGERAIATYLVNGTLYQHSTAFESRYGSAWVRSALGDDAGATWRRQDPLRRQRALLANATVTVAGTETVGGVETRVLAVDGDEESYEALLRTRLGRLGANASVDVENISFRMYVATDTDRLRYSTGTVESTVAYGGASVSLTERLRLRFWAYGDRVNVTLPEGAATAVEPSASG